MPGARGPKEPAPSGAAAWREQAQLWRAQKDPIDDVEGGLVVGLRRWFGVGGDEAELHATEEEQQGLLGKAQKSLSNMAERAGGTVASGVGGNVGAMMQIASISKDRWVAFFGLLTLGCLLMGASWWMLPLIVLAPHKFAGLFTTGSLCFMAGISVLKGPVAFAAHLLSGSRLAVSAGYVGSMVATIWASMWYRSAPLTMAFSVLQIVELLWLAASYIPGGSMALGFVCEWLSFGLRRLLCAACCSSKLGSAPL